MVDAVLNKTGLYQTALTAGQPYTVECPSRFARSDDHVEIINHGIDPIYIRLGTTITVKDPDARIIGGGQGLADYTIPAGQTYITLISATDSSFSISR